MVVEIFSLLNEVLPPQFFLISFFFGFLLLVWIGFGTERKTNKLKEWGETEKVMFSLILGVFFYNFVYNFFFPLSIVLKRISPTSEIADFNKNLYSSIFFWGLICMFVLFTYRLEDGLKTSFLSFRKSKKKRVLTTLVGLLVMSVLSISGIGIIEHLFHKPSFLYLTRLSLASLLFNPIFWLWVYYSSPIRINKKTIRMFLNKYYFIVLIPIIFSIIWFLVFIPYVITSSGITKSIRISKFGDKVIFVNETIFNYTVIPKYSEFVYFPTRHDLNFPSKCISFEDLAIINCSFDSSSTIIYFKSPIINPIKVETLEFIPWFQSSLETLNKNGFFISNKIVKFNLSYSCLYQTNICFINISVSNLMDTSIRFDNFQLFKLRNKVNWFSYEPLYPKPPPYLDISFENNDILTLNEFQVGPRSHQEVSFKIKWK